MKPLEKCLISQKVGPIRTNPKAKNIASQIFNSDKNFSSNSQKGGMIEKRDYPYILDPSMIRYPSPNT
tara:strand:+ start:329 stop:532 length:204 start_codon:yes stop_codon:yes gene_type:complete